MRDTSDRRVPTVGLLVPSPRTLLGVWGVLVIVLGALAGLAALLLWSAMAPAHGGGGGEADGLRFVLPDEAQWAVGLGYAMVAVAVGGTVGAIAGLLLSGLTWWRAPRPWPPGWHTPIRRALVLQVLTLLPTSFLATLALTVQAESGAEAGVTLAVPAVGVLGAAGWAYVLRGISTSGRW